MLSSREGNGLAPTLSSTSLDPSYSSNILPSDRLEVCIYAPVIGQPSKSEAPGLLACFAGGCQYRWALSGISKAQHPKFQLLQRQ